MAIVSSVVNTMIMGAMALGAVATGVTSIVKAARGKPKGPEAPKMPGVADAPDPSESKGKSADSMRKRRQALKSSGRTRYTSALGSAGQANVARKQLLGQ